MQDYYKVLEVSKTATQEEIKQNYRMLAKKWHPDANGNTKESEEKFKAINEAYSHLSSPERRREYDAMSSFQYSRQQQQGFNRSDNTRRGPTYNTRDWEFTYTYTTRKKDDISDYALGKIVKGVLQVGIGIFLLPVPVFSIVGVYVVYSGISNIRKGISRL